MISRLTTLAVLLVVTAPVLAADIQRVEPPFWWTGFEHRELQLMVHGDDIGDMAVSIDQPGIRIQRVERVDSENYLFLYLVIDESVNPGAFTIRFEHDSQVIEQTYELKQKNPDPEHTRGFSQQDAIYLLTPDRFANGDTSNDTVEGYADGLNRADDYGRHGGDLAGIANHLDYLSDMGYTQLWLNPILENNVARASYHGYSTTDFYTVDPRFGSNAQFAALTEAAGERGLGMIMDMIANHIGDGHWWMHDLPTSDWLNFQGAPVITSHARTVNQDRYASDYDRQMHVDGWFVTTMPDLNQRNPLLADYLIQNAIWWIEYVGLNGIRMDTWPYPDKHFMAEWARRIMQEYPDFNIVGEEWSVNPAIVSYWQRGKVNADGYVSHLPSVFDFPLQAALVEALTEDGPDWRSPWTSVYESVANDFLYPDPSNIVIFPDNHDMNRTYTQLNEDFALFRMTMVFYATMRGIPQFFYGHEILMSHPGTDSHGALRMDFPGGWDDDAQNGFYGEGLSDEALEAQALVRQLLTWRRDESVIHTGDYMHFAPIDEVFAYFRYNDEKTVMVVFNRDDAATTLDMQRFAERTQSATRGTDVLTGRTVDIRNTIELEPRSVLLLELE
ncbi:MAG: glycoside hydrolase family 13 protein [Pseudomonadota bacterium]